STVGTACTRGSVCRAAARIRLRRKRAARFISNAAASLIYAMPLIRATRTADTSTRSARLAYFNIDNGAAATSATSFASCATICSKHALRSEEHTSELQSRENLVCRLLLEKKKGEQDG